MKEFFKELFEYNHNVNQKVAEVFKTYPHKTSEKSIQLFSHIIDAHHIWNSRINGKTEQYAVWMLQPVSAFEDIDTANYQESLQVLASFDLNHHLNYTNSRGLTFNNSIRDTLFHVINHSNYHRAQIATEFKLNGIEPLLTDYIMYKR